MCTRRNLAAVSAALFILGAPGSGLEALAQTTSQAVLPPHLRQPPPLPHRRGHSPCSEQPGVFLFAPPPPPPLHTAMVPPPAKAVAEHVTGCAGVRFHIGPDGRPRDITVAMEFPGNYGFGETARQVVAGSFWPPHRDESWHYVNLKINPPAAKQ